MSSKGSNTLKRKYVTISVNQKLELIRKLEAGASVARVCDEYGVKKQTVIEKNNSHELRKKLLQEKNLTLDKVLDIARALEAANSQAQTIEDRSHNDSQVNSFNYHQ
ncbi:putative Tigger transposable element-derived protein 7-like 79 [Homarus americanus]|uniref:Putative Tigger transposable element-derived protein 7-like 79 n=1 Tax=Homarus americanus TaxID=6706 RepID=A0A8J5JHT3_HOMAM|nr:putative Tigger transposable element-derived protein 7-like 80 [Homarus americanus]KAG7163877.1 putative Tigger transposable element-derived protein 7-like 79 [Homarus americanus]